MASAPTLSRQTTGNTAFYSFVSNTSTVHPEMSTTAAPVAGTSTRTKRAATDSDPSPDYHPETNGSTSTAPIDSKTMHLDEKRPLDAPIDEKQREVAPTKSDAAGPSNDVVAPTSLAPSSPSREEQLSHHAVGAFAGGAVLANPTSDPNATLTSRSATADAQLTDAARSKITKSEARNSKQMQKILKGEAKSQAATLSASVKELARLQKIQKQAAAEESKALRRHTKAVATEQKQSAIFAKIKAAFEAATAELTSATENLDNTRTHAKQQSEALKTKTLEVEQATRQKGTDDREREIRIAELKTIEQSAPKSKLGCL